MEIAKNFFRNFYIFPALKFIFLPLGPNLPQPCAQSSMVTSPDGQGVILLGCDKNPESIYELREIDGVFSWRKMSQKLKHPRTLSVAMSIPNEFVTCT